jgi:hypothetical protein
MSGYPEDGLVLGGSRLSDKNAEVVTVKLFRRKKRADEAPTHDDVVRELHALEHEKKKLDAYDARHNQNPASETSTASGAYLL